MRGRILPADLWWNTSGHNNLEKGLPLLNLGARVVLVMSGLQGSAPVLPVRALYAARSRYTALPSATPA